MHSQHDLIIHVYKHNHDDTWCRYVMYSVKLHCIRADQGFKWWWILIFRFTSLILVWMLDFEWIISILLKGVRDYFETAVFSSILQNFQWVTDTCALKFAKGVRDDVENATIHVHIWWWVAKDIFAQYTHKCKIILNQVVHFVFSGEDPGPWIRVSRFYLQW